jgi:hypothetical protein
MEINYFLTEMKWLEGETGWELAEMKKFGAGNRVRMGRNEIVAVRN